MFYYVFGDGLLVGGLPAHEVVDADLAVVVVPPVGERHRPREVVVGRGQIGHPDEAEINLSVEVRGVAVQPGGVNHVRRSPIGLSDVVREGNVHPHRVVRARPRTTRCG